MKRWLLWNAVCLRGRLCADVVLEDPDTSLPMGAVVHIGYTCAACGTHYEFDTKTQSRVRVPRPKEGQTVRLGPGEKTTAVFKLPDPRDN